MALKLARSTFPFCDQMMIGIKAVSIYLPEQQVSNLELTERFGIEADFLSEKIGVLNRPIKSEKEDTSDMALEALERLIKQSGLVRGDIQALVVVTQNPDSNLPHVSGLVHGRAKLSSDCAAFDLSLGCSGYVYGLSVLQSFLTANGLSKGVLITCDPYSKVIDPKDKNTALLFGDAATATLVGPAPVFICGPFVFGTQGDLNGALVCNEGTLKMNGREVFNFAVTVVPKCINKLLENADLTEDEVDSFIFHQGSRYILEKLTKRSRLDPAKVRIDIKNTGNTVSSSIPLLLHHEINNRAIKRIVLCGFGVGLSWAGCVLERIGEQNG